MDGAGRPQGTRPSPAVDPWRARVPAKPAIPAATTGSRRRHDAARPHHPCMSRPAQHLDLATDAQTGKQRWHSDRRIGTPPAPAGPRPTNRCAGLARGGRGSAASHLRDARRNHAIAHVVQGHGLPARGGHGGLAAGIAQLHGRKLTPAQAQRGVQQQRQQGQQQHGLDQACPRCAQAEGTSLMACPPGLPPQARQQPAGPANTGGTRWQARLAHPGSATAGRNRSAPCWTP